ncbi:MAG: transaldolase family protein [Bacillota bacterium]
MIDYNYGQLCINGVGVVEEIINIYRVHQYSTKVLAASFKNVEQVHQACLRGVHGVTLSPELVGQLIYHPMTDMSVENFIADWEAYYGVGTKTY